ncbi:MAG: FAD-dependent oxidoreductase [Acidimicrobiales bacterium]|nr:FAD-dependent oxidoreductase [Acidimicrobiales bacterium]
MSAQARRPSLGARVAELADLPHRRGAPRSRPDEDGSSPESCDVLVAGSGGAALTAAAAALSAGATVMICEKGAVPGGTTACSGGVAHIYANHCMAEAGIDDPRADALRYMARVGYPTVYDPEAPALGLEAADHAQLEAYYDRGAEVMARLAAIGAVRMEAPWRMWDGQAFPDYYEFPENKARRGRGLQCMAPDGGAGNGAELVRQLVDFCTARGSEVRLGHRVVDLVVEDGTVTGAVVDDGRVSRRVRARGGVVFGSGGFAHNPELRHRFLRGPIGGGSGVPTNTGDLISLAVRAGAELGGMHNGWWNQQVVEALDDDAPSVLDVWSIPGDGMIVVNRFGVRVVDEKREYETRGRAHHVFQGDEYVNRVLFMVYDQRTAERFGGRYPIPPLGAVADHVVRAEGVEGLAEALEERVRTRLPEVLPPGFGAVALDGRFASTLRETISRFNGMAEAGRDDEFRRGTKAVEVAFHGPPASDHRLPNPLLHPLDADGTLYVIALVGTTFDTNSGPRIDGEGRVLSPDGPVAGLYGAGNCVDSVFGEGYPGGGSTIGPGMVFGFLAGAHAAGRAGLAGRPAASAAPVTA